MQPSGLARFRYRLFADGWRRSSRLPDELVEIEVFPDEPIHLQGLRLVGDSDVGGLSEQMLTVARAAHRRIQLRTTKSAGDSNDPKMTTERLEHMDAKQLQANDILDCWPVADALPVGCTAS